MEPSLIAPSSAAPVPYFGAGIGLRLAARLIDFVVHTIIGLSAIFVVSILTGIAAIAAGIEPSILISKLKGTTITGVIAAELGYIAYHTICEGMHGATLGKLILKIHVVQSDGQPCTFLSALIRSLAFIVDSLFLGVVAFMSMRGSDLQQRNGDIWAHTVVVERARFKGTPRRSGWRFLAVFLLALAADGLIYSASLLLKVLF